MLAMLVFLLVHVQSAGLTALQFYYSALLGA